MAGGEKNNPKRVNIEDPGVLRLLELLRQEGRNGVYVLVFHEGRLVKVYRTSEVFRGGVDTSLAEA